MPRLLLYSLCVQIHNRMYTHTHIHEGTDGREGRGGLSMWNGFCHPIGYWIPLLVNSSGCFITIENLSLSLFCSHILFELFSRFSNRIPLWMNEEEEQNGILVASPFSLFDMCPPFCAFIHRSIYLFRRPSLFPLQSYFGQSRTKTHDPSIAALGYTYRRNCLNRVLNWLFVVLLQAVNRLTFLSRLQQQQKLHGIRFFFFVT